MSNAAHRSTLRLMDLDTELTALAAQEDLPAHLVQRLLRHPAARRMAALKRRDLTEEQIEQIIALGSARSLAANRSVPATIKARLAEHPDSTVRCAAAATATNEPPGLLGLLARLADDPEPLVRSFLAMNEHLPAELGARLAADPDPGVRESAAEYCRNVPDMVRRALFADPEPGVRQRAVVRWSPPLEMLPALLADPATRVATARHAPPSRELASDPDPSVRIAVAAHPELPTDLRDLLAEDSNPPVRSEIAFRPDTPPALREQLEATLTTEDPAEAFHLSFRRHTCPSPAPAPSPPPHEQAEALLTQAGL
ncbi:hypothetical protein ACFY0A_38270 [Streptomyces sp. NPDC001698]|uniref:hypothetical protein n=1 Tax=unclassified Streptomyces TaxID=2593676 RepID=UPI003679DE54